MHKCCLYNVLSGSILQVTGPFFTPCCLPLLCSSLSPLLHIPSSVCTTLLNPLGMPDPQVCILASGNFPVCLRFLNNPAISVTDEVCFLPLFICWVCASVCSCLWLPPLLIIPFGIEKVFDQIPFREQRLPPSTHPCTNKFTSFQGS